MNRYQIFPIFFGYQNDFTCLRLNWAGYKTNLTEEAYLNSD